MTRIVFGVVAVSTKRLSLLVCVYMCARVRVSYGALTDSGQLLAIIVRWIATLYRSLLEDTLAKLVHGGDISGRLNKIGPASAP